MKILHTGDWHLGKRLGEFSRLEEQRAVLDEIVEVAEREGVDAVLVTGDLFDTFNPPIEAEELLYRTLKRLGDGGRRAVIAIAGNHDSPDRVQTTDPLARECGIFFAGYPHTEIAPIKLDTKLAITRSAPGFVEFQFPRRGAPRLRLLITPYANEYRMKTWLGVEDPEAALREALQAWWSRLAGEYCDGDGVNVLMAHLYVAASADEELQEPEEEKPILLIGGAQAVFSANLPPGIQYAALGHLHHQHEAAREPAPAVYCGSPLCFSFSEAGQQKSVVIVEASPGGEPATWRSIPLTQGRPVLRGQFETVDEAVAWLSANPETLVELTMKTADYLTGADRRRLHEAHSGIVQIIPLPAGGDHAEGEEAGLAIDPQGNIQELFAMYFQHRHGQPPGEDIMGLFREMLSLADEEPAAGAEEDDDEGEYDEDGADSARGEDAAP